MRTLLILAAGLWLGRRISLVLSENRTRERELNLRKRLEGFISEQLPVMRPEEVKQRLKELFK